MSDRNRDHWHEWQLQALHGPPLDAVDHSTPMSYLLLGRTVVDGGFPTALLPRTQSELAWQVVDRFGLGVPAMASIVEKLVVLPEDGGQAREWKWPAGPRGYRWPESALNFHPEHGYGEPIGFQRYQAYVQEEKWVPLGLGWSYPEQSMWAAHRLHRLVSDQSPVVVVRVLDAFSLH